MKQIDLEWRALASRAVGVVPDDDEENRSLVDDYFEANVAPRGCSITNGSDIARTWVAKTYIGGMQRVLGYGTCYQCARLYDAAIWRFAKYRTAKQTFGDPYNFDAKQAESDNADPLIGLLLSDMEKLLLSRGELRTPEQRSSEAKQRRADYRHDRYTSTGRMEKLIEQIFAITESQTQVIEKLIKRVDSLALIIETQRGVFHPPVCLPVIPPTGPGYISPVIGDPDRPMLTCQGKTDILAGQSSNGVQS